MAKIWRNRLIAGTQQWEDCPDKYKSSVRALLRLDVMNNVITKEKYEGILHEEY